MLSHLRVIDLTDGGAGIAGQLLADLGADVILIEPPGGARSRHLGPFADDRVDPDRSLEFWSVHRGKRSVTLDLFDAADRKRLKQLAAGSDVWIEACPPGEMAPRELGYEDLAPLAPQLVHASITPFGESGPKRDWAATDLTVTAASHAMWLTGDSDRAPLSCSVPQAFLHAGAEAAAMVMVGIAERVQSGRGQHIDVSAQTAMMTASQSTLLAHSWKDKPLGRSGGGVKVGDYRLRFIYECADGYVNLTFLFGEPLGRATARFFDWMDAEGFSNDAIRNEDWVAYGAKILGGKSNNDAHEAVMTAIERFTRTKTKAELFAAAFEKRLLLVPLSDCGDLLRSKQLAERQFWSPVTHPALDREVLHPGPFAKFSETPIRNTVPAPRLGAHTEEVLGETQRVVTETGSPGARELPLAGLKVLDFTWVYAGPAITRMLADFGATVVKIESNTANDPLRANGPFKDAQAGSERSGNFANINLGKHSIGINLKAPGARELALSLVDWADVVVENFSPRAMKSWGLDWEKLRQRKPELVMLSSCLSGASGPEAALAGYGTMGAALAGFGFVTGWPDRRPSAPFMAYTDYVSPRFATAALLAALEHKRRTGVGQHIDLSQAECTIHFLGSAILEASVNDRIPGARGNASAHYAPSGVHATRGEDSWIAIAAPEPGQWEALAALAAAGWADDARFATAEARLEHREALDAAISGWTASQELETLEAQLQAAGVPAHRVADSQDTCLDPQLRAREHFVEIDHAELGPMPYENTRSRFSETPGRPRPCPTLGQHNSHVLHEILGLSEDEALELVLAGAIE